MSREADRAEQALEDGAAAGLADAARLVLERAKGNIGRGDPAKDPDPAVALAEAGRIEDDGHGGIVIVFDTPYAAWQHENQHARHPRGGGAKYLERALTELAPTFEGIVATQVRARLGSGLLSSDPNRPHR